MQMGVINVQRPRIRPILHMLEPIIFPRASEGLFWKAASMLTISSGVLVPIATNVKPMINREAFSLSASETLPLTRDSPPKYKRKNPSSMRAMLEYMGNGVQE